MLARIDLGVHEHAGRTVRGQRVVELRLLPELVDLLKVRRGAVDRPRRRAPAEAARRSRGHAHRSSIASGYRSIAAVAAADVISRAESSCAHATAYRRFTEAAATFRLHHARRIARQASRSRRWNNRNTTAYDEIVATTPHRTSRKRQYDERGDDDRTAHGEPRMGAGPTAARIAATQAGSPPTPPTCPSRFRHRPTATALRSRSTRHPRGDRPRPPGPCR